jgi:hypothetical protein
VVSAISGTAAGAAALPNLVLQLLQVSLTVSGWGVKDKTPKVVVAVSQNSSRGRSTEQVGDAAVSGKRATRTHVLLVACTI